MRAQLRLPPHPTSARRARQFVETTIAAWRLAVSAEIAVLLTSEVVTNAVLYAASDLELVVEAEDDRLQVAVHDRNPLPPLHRTPSPDAASGRGLELVTALASGWGIDPDASGKWVWFQLAPDGPDDHRPHRDGFEHLPSQDTVAVRLTDVPAATFVRLNRHLESLLYEVQVLAGGSHQPPPDADLQALAGLLERSGDVRSRARVQAEEADRHQRERVEIRLHLLPEAAANSEELSALLDRADDLGRAGRLLTVPADVEMARLRAWVFEEIVNQVRHGRPPRPCPW